MTTQPALFPSLQSHELQERSSMKGHRPEGHASSKLHAQETVHQLIIVASGCAFVWDRRLDAYYRNDPSKYGLDWFCTKNIFVFLMFYYSCGVLKHLEKTIIEFRNCKIWTSHSSLKIEWILFAFANWILVIAALPLRETKDIKALKFDEYHKQN